MSIEVRTVDPRDEAAFRTFYETWRVAAPYGRVDPPLYTYEEMLAGLLEPDASEDREIFVAYDGDRPVGAGSIEVPLLDNTDQLFFDIAVLPDERRRGVGSALFAHVSARAGEKGRTSLLADVAAPVDGGPAPGEAFLSKRGLTLRINNLRRQLRLPVAPGLLESLAEKASQKTGDYRLVTWVDATPEEYAEQYAVLKGLLSVEAPTGTMELEQEKWDVARLRDEERITRAQGRTLYTTVAVAPDRTLAGHTQLAVPRHDPGRAFQWDTLVFTEHRGHRLGLALKVENLRAMQAAHPDITRVDTWNAEQNGPMIAVNKDMGFTVIETLQEWQS